MIFKGNDIEETLINSKTSRKLLSYGGDLMMTEVKFAKGGVGTPHAHPDHEQVSYILNGSFEITVGDDKAIVVRGDGFYAPKDVMHGVVALEDDSIILDIFTPIRQDFLV